jgi:MoaA/NifB/PqqE/SkfB family radical SAM enzyme
MIHEPKNNMTLENYIKLLHYLTEYNNIKEVGIIGGEPTLHPFFKEILIESN